MFAEAQIISSTGILFPARGERIILKHPFRIQVEEIMERRADYTRLLINPCFTNPSVISQLDQFIITNCLTTFSTNDEMYEGLI